MVKKRIFYLILTIILFFSYSYKEASANTDYVKSKENVIYLKDNNFKKITDTDSKEEILKYVYSYLDTNKKILGFSNNASDSFNVKKIKKENGIFFVKMQQVIDNVPIYGSDITISINTKNKQIIFFGKITKKISSDSIEKNKKISSEKAIELLKKQQDFALSKKPEEVYYLSNNNLIRTYLVTTTLSNYYFLSTEDGEIVDKINGESFLVGKGYNQKNKLKKFPIEKENDYFLLKNSERQINVYTANNMDRLTFQLLSQFYEYFGENVKSSNIFFEDKVAIDAYLNIIHTYDYFKENYNLKSYDNNESKINLTVHVGENWNNASWNGRQIVIGDGDGKKFAPLSGARDIVAHEYTHAIIQHTANLQLNGESGVINESLADIFGVLSDGKNWIIGEDVYTPNKKGDFLRSLENPKKTGSPDHINDYNPEEDNHFNSGFLNKAAYLIANGGKHYELKIKGIGKEKLGAIYYYTLTNYLTSTTDFTMFKTAILQSTTELFGENSKEFITVKKSFTSVGL